uniref:Uncharacterized protein n=1 Tax=Megaselia scalaris TaxID=36166 RepID=T1GZ93_MEGSC
MKHGLSSNFNKLCNALAKLEEEGISFEIDGKYVQVYFVITYIHGDNLGLNSMLGYKKIFVVMDVVAFALLPLKKYKVA